MTGVRARAFWERVHGLLSIADLYGCGCRAVLSARISWESMNRATSASMPKPVCALLHASKHPRRAEMGRGTRPHRLSRHRPGSGHAAGRHRHRQVSPPDTTGRCSLGLSCTLCRSYGKRLLPSIEIPRTRGSFSSASTDEFDAVYEIDAPLVEYERVTMSGRRGTPPLYVLVSAWTMAMFCSLALARSKRRCCRHCPTIADCGSIRE